MAQLLKCATLLVATVIFMAAAVARDTTPPDPKAAEFVKQLGLAEVPPRCAKCRAGRRPGRSC